MRIEALCTGDELLTGLTADTNSPFFMEKVLQLGLGVARITVVGDSVPEIASLITELAGRCEVVLVSGGLGPTSDDLTLEAAAQAARLPLVEDPLVRGWLTERFAKAGRELSSNNLRQARLPQGAAPVRNPVGTAPMVVLKLGRCTFFFVPGVPREYRHLVEQEVIPRIGQLAGAGPASSQRALAVLKTVGLPESALDAKVEPLRQAHPSVTFGFLTRAPENHLKLMAEAPTALAARMALESASMACRQVLSKWLFAEGSQSFAQAIAAQLMARGQTVALAESCTGGLAAQMLTAVPGASAWFLGSAVTYQGQLKQRWAGVKPQALALGEVSREVTLEMAAGVRAQTGADFGVAFTGHAGPSGGTPQDPVGTYYCALSYEGGAQVERDQVEGDRERVRHFAAYRGLELLRQAALGVR